MTAPEPTAEHIDAVALALNTHAASQHASDLLTSTDHTVMPRLCTHHRGVYRARTAAIRHLPHGHKALAREARLIAAQCPECIAVTR